MEISRVKLCPMCQMGGNLVPLCKVVSGTSQSDSEADAMTFLAPVLSL